MEKSLQINKASMYTQHQNYEVKYNLILHANQQFTHYIASVLRQGFIL